MLPIDDDHVSQTAIPHHFHLNNSHSNINNNRHTLGTDPPLPPSPPPLPSSTSTTDDDDKKLDTDNNNDTSNKEMNQEDKVVQSQAQPQLTSTPDEEDEQQSIQSPTKRPSINKPVNLDTQDQKGAAPANPTSPTTPPAATTTPHDPALPPQFFATTNMFSFMDDGGVSSFFDNALPRTQATFSEPEVSDQNGVEQGGGPNTDFLYTAPNLNLEDYPTPTTQQHSPPDIHETESHDSGGEPTGLVEGRVEASKMGEVDNPLQKRGRHTVITGHLPESNPYSIAERNLGIKMCSLKLQTSGIPTGLSRAEAFARDLQEFLVEINLTGYKVPVIGGGPLDLFALMREVLLLGGVTNVVKKRAFRIVGQQLELPKSCTSAAFVLKNAYTRLLFYYEGKLVFDEMPENPCRNVNIKQIVAADKERDRMQAKIRSGLNNTSANGGNRRRVGDDRKRRMSMPTGTNMGLYRMHSQHQPEMDLFNSSTLDYDHILDIVDHSQLNEQPHMTTTSTTKRLRLTTDSIEDEEMEAGGGGENQGQPQSQQQQADQAIMDAFSPSAVASVSLPAPLGAPTPLGAAADYEFSREYYMSLVSNNNNAETGAAIMGDVGIAASSPSHMDGYVTYY